MLFHRPKRPNRRTGIKRPRQSDTAKRIATARKSRHYAARSSAPNGVHIGYDHSHLSKYAITLRQFSKLNPLFPRWRHIRGHRPSVQPMRTFLTRRALDGQRPSVRHTTTFLTGRILKDSSESKTCAFSPISLVRNAVSHQVKNSAKISPLSYYQTSIKTNPIIRPRAVNRRIMQTPERLQPIEFPPNTHKPNKWFFINTGTKNQWCDTEGGLCLTVKSHPLPGRKSPTQV